MIRTLLSSALALVALVWSGSSLAAAPRYAELADLTRSGTGVWTFSARAMRVLTPQAAAAQGAIPSSQARQYRAVLLPTNQPRQTLRVAANARVTLLRYPDFAPRASRPWDRCCAATSDCPLTSRPRGCSR